jgi:hypothetical protein
MTEAEATAAQCCGPSQCGQARGGYRTCVGSACMAWRWEVQPLAPPTDTALTIEVVVDAETERRWRELDARRGRGFCGLAGQP